MIEKRHIVIIILIICPIIILLVGVFKEIKWCIIGGIIGLFGTAMISTGIMVHTSTIRHHNSLPVTSNTERNSFEVINPLPV